MKNWNLIKIPAGFLLFAGIAAATPSLAAQTTAEPAFEIDDTSLFPPEFFPGLQERSEAELILAGLRSIYPERILEEPPRSELPEPAAPIVRKLGNSGNYVRVLSLPEALPVIEQHLSQDILLLDLRFLSADLDNALQLAALLSRQPQLTLRVAGDYPASGETDADGLLSVESRQLRGPKQAVFILSNHQTRGPLEAVLDQLKHDGDIISIGTASAGQTAVFNQFPNLPSYYLMTGEIRAADGDSIVESGFAPRVEVSVAPNDDLIGYSSLREDVSIEQVVQARVDKTRFDEARLLRERGLDTSATPESDEEDEAKEEEDLPLDLILQRAMNIVKALQALGEIGK